MRSSFLAFLTTALALAASITSKVDAQVRQALSLRPGVDVEDMSREPLDYFLKEAGQYGYREGPAHESASMRPLILFILSSCESSGVLEIRCIGTPPPCHASALQGRCSCIAGRGCPALHLWSWSGAELQQGTSARDIGLRERWNALRLGCVVRNFSSLKM